MCQRSVVRVCSKSLMGWKEGTLGLTDVSLKLIGNMDQIDFSSNCYLIAVLDASSKAPAGILDGTLSSFGDYDQCLQVKSDNVKLGFDGQHCMVKLSSDTDKSSPSEIDTFIRDKLPVYEYFYLNLALCLPSTCSVQDVSALVNQGN